MDQDYGSFGSVFACSCRVNRLVDRAGGRQRFHRPRARQACRALGDLVADPDRQLFLLHLYLLFRGARHPSPPQCDHRAQWRGGGYVSLVVIASVPRKLGMRAKQSRARTRGSGLLRRFVPRNDERSIGRARHADSKTGSSSASKPISTGNGSRPIAARASRSTTRPMTARSARVPEYGRGRDAARDRGCRARAARLARADRQGARGDPAPMVRSDDGEPGGSGAAHDGGAGQAAGRDRAARSPMPHPSSNGSARKASASMAM